MRALGEPAGSRRLTGEKDTGEEYPRGDGDDDAGVDDRTSPFPYSEKFDDWVADETAAGDEREHGRDTGSRDSPS